MAYDQENIFKKIIEGAVPCFKIFETDHCIAILDAFPMVRGHSLLIPKAEVVTLMDLQPDTAANVLKELPRLCKAVMAATNADGVNVFQNNLPSAGQVVMHAHFHVVPRFTGDNLMRFPGSAKTMIDQQEGGAVLAQIQAKMDDQTQEGGTGET
ncbi:unnamed protein product [Vitrella brassicaformis CCMP3155]|uniref:HIT domain-containing protein n=2 Tax=Vitrella brassicaformis TaxID=1169539 RepID=A0A0G4EY22_VITBC|nr:unnamed protein product [Vitrella brassicaformis CCMP3155]|eukprot:CEM03626.1 unnamed protein product [Vitrella brassicaformis CCMP3155]